MNRRDLLKAVPLVMVPGIVVGEAETVGFHPVPGVDGKLRRYSVNALKDDPYIMDRYGNIVAGWHRVNIVDGGAVFTPVSVDEIR